MLIFCKEDPDVFLGVVGRLEDQVSRIRVGAIVTLRSIARPGSPEIVQVLVGQLHDEIGDVRLAALDAMLELVDEGDATAISALSSAVFSDELCCVRVHQGAIGNRQ